MLKILVDVDDVVLDLVPNWLSYYNREFKDKIKKEDILDWDIAQFVKPEAKLSIYDYVRHGEIFDTARPVPYSLEGIRVLRSKECRIVFVTAGDPRNIKERWLKRNGYLEHINDYVVTTDKSHIIGDYIIDDKFENVTNSSAKGWLFKAPWNKKHSFEYRVDNWLHIIDKLDKQEFFR